MFDFDIDNSVSQEITDQGIFFQNRIKTLIQEGQPTAELLEQTTGPNLGSIIEPFSNSSLSVIEHITYLLNQYDTIYGKFNEQLKNKGMNKLIQKYGNTNVSDGSNNYYINRFGFMHPYAKDITKGSYCPTDTPIPLEKHDFDMFANFRSYELANSDQPCVAGTSIINDKNTAWVDIAGRKHKFEDWNKKSKSCQQASGLSTLNIENSKVFNAIPLGEPGIYQKDSPCNIINVDKTIVNELTSLQNQLSEAIIELQRHITEAQNNDDANVDVLDKLLNQATTATTNLKGGLNELGKLEQNPETHIDFDLQNIRDDSGLKVNSNYLQFMIWLVLCIFLIILTIYTFSATEQSVISQLIIVGMAIYILYRAYEYIQYQYF